MSDRREPLPTRVEGLPSLPVEFQLIVDRGLSALGLDLDERARRAIEDHVRLVLAWTGAINLTAIRDPGAIALGHVVDSLTAEPLIRSRGGSPILDLGSGAGFPGFPLAIACSSSRVLLVESVGKKARFLATVADALELRPRVAVAATRAETLGRDPHHRGRWPIVVARAVGPLAELLELASPLVPIGGVLIAWKRRRSDEPGPSVVGMPGESEAAGRAAAALGWAAPVARGADVPGLEDHLLVVVDKTGPTRPGIPRDPAARRRRPW